MPFCDRRPKRKRPSRIFLAGWVAGPPTSPLEPRLLAAAIFIRDPNNYFDPNSYALGFHALSEDAIYYDASQPAGDEQSMDGDLGANASSSFSAGYGPGIMASEQGTAAISVAAPDSSPGATTQTLEFIATHDHTDTINAAPGGPYQAGVISQLHQSSAIDSVGTKTWDLQDSGGGNLTGTINVYFSANLTSPSDSRFLQDATLSLDSNYLDIRIQSGPDTSNFGVIAYDPQTNAMYGANYSFGKGQGATSSFSVAVSVPIPANTQSLPLTVSFSDEFTTFPGGWFSNETATNISHFAWTFSMTPSN